MAKTYYCTLDTETFGGAAKPKGIYNLSGSIHDRLGEIVASFNFLISEHFHEIAADDYGKKNFPRYQEMVAGATITSIASENMAIQIVKDLLDFYNVKYVMAFNTGFDYCKTKCRELLEGREFIDIQLMACQIFGRRPSYIDFCRKNGLASKSGKSVATSAESFYAFLTNNPEYIEEHTAREDSLIELEIFRRCMAAHKAYTKNCHFFDFPDKWNFITPFAPREK